MKSITERRLADEKTEATNKPAKEVSSGDTVPKDPKLAEQKNEQGGAPPVPGSTSGVEGEDTTPVPEPGPKTPEEMRSIDPKELVEPEDPNKANGEAPGKGEGAPVKTDEAAPDKDQVKMYAADPEITALMKDLKGL